MNPIFFIVSVSALFYFVPKFKYIPIYFLFVFVIFDWLNLFYLNAIGYSYYQIFQGSSLLLIVYLFVKLVGISNKWVAIFLCFLSIHTIIALGAGNDIVKVVASLKNIILFITLFSLIAKGYSEWNLSSLCILFLVLFLSVYIQLVQSLMGLESYIFSLGFDEFYNQRSISSIGDVPIGFLTNNPITGEIEERWLGIFLSPDKFPYLINLACLIFIGFINFKKKISFTINIILIIFVILILWFLHVKAVLLQFLIFSFSFYVCYYFKIKSFYARFFVIVFSLIICVIGAVSFVPASVLSSTGAIQHLWGLVNPLLNSHPISVDFWLGNGMGSGGTVGGGAYAEQGLTKHDVGGESFVGALFYQLGIVGVSLYLFVVKLIDDWCRSQCLLKKYFLIRYSLCSSLIISVPIASAFSEPMMSFFQVVTFSLAFVYISNYREGKL
ncbi:MULTISPECIES: hypothetical protein [unclassified Colwellia]|uniref:hypothetical protein n=1 Tax=unclassified Colwellia TaxID=196834 RepID=UPI0015F588CB|nr:MULTISPECIES: hypothetical protein [unclassified Colwellia]MBA6257123.1 hypothetical protein [Colwellia sp. MB3u-28]MBA6258645.1 hypothetical protein [Colwellia sp. MB3u-41]